MLYSSERGCLPDQLHDIDYKFDFELDGKKDPTVSWNNLPLRSRLDASFRDTTPASIASTISSASISPDRDESVEISSASSYDSDTGPPEQHHHPRRTSVGITPPSLQRCDRKHKIFVEGLLTVTTSFVETIWPLSRETPRSSTDFNGAGVLPLRTFIQETCRRSKTSYSTLQIALYYLVLLKGVLPDLDFTREQHKESEHADRTSRDPQILLGQPYGPSGSRVMQCGRRMFMSALMLAAKYLQDRNFSVKAWAKISGLSCTEINKNEKAYLQSIEYRLHLKKEHFDNWSQIVVELCQSTRTQRSLDFLKVIQRLKPDIIYDAETTKHFLKEIEQGNYHDADTLTACRAQHFGIYCRDNKDSISPIPHTPLNSLLKAGMSFAIRDSSCPSDQFPSASLYRCPPPRPGCTKVVTALREHSGSPLSQTPCQSMESSSSSPDSAMDSVFSDVVGIVSRSRSSSMSSAASFGSQQNFRHEDKVTSLSLLHYNSIVAHHHELDADYVNPKSPTLATIQYSHFTALSGMSQDMTGCAKRKALSGPTASESAAATLVMLSKNRVEHSIISAVENTMLSSKKALKTRGPAKSLKPGHTSEFTKAKRQKARDGSRMFKAQHTVPDAAYSEAVRSPDYAEQESEEEKENQIGNKLWAETRKPVRPVHNPNKRCAQNAADRAASTLRKEMLCARRQGLVS